jgi:hypothetical protein
MTGRRICFGMARSLMNTRKPQNSRISIITAARMSAATSPVRSMPPAQCTSTVPSGASAIAATARAKFEGSHSSSAR